jgi:hypothetical protein
MIAVLTFLRSPMGRYVLIGLAMLVVVVGFGAWNRNAQHKHDLPAMVDAATHQPWKAEALAAQRDLGTCRTNTATLEASLGRQNAAVEALAKASATRVAQSAKAASDARAVAESYRRSAAGVLAAKAGPDRCASADEVILGAVR